MAVKRIKTELAYGLGDALIPLSPRPIVAVRNPATNDRAELGTIWVNKSNNTVYCISSVVGNISTWTVIS